MTRRCSKPTKSELKILAEALAGRISQAEASRSIGILSPNFRAWLGGKIIAAVKHGLIKVVSR